MIKPLLNSLLTILFLFFAGSAFSQTGNLPGSDGKVKHDDKSTDGTSSIKFGINYSSNNVFMGRTDTIRTPTIIPQIKYTLKSGIYFSGSIDIIPNRKKKKLDGGDLTAGYDFDITDDLSGGASYSKLFYNSTSTQIASAISSTFNANLNYDIGNIISPSISADYNINKQGINNDIFVNFSLTHDFIVAGVFGDADILLISPTATANTGTENFYDAYLTKKTFKNAKRTAAQNALITKYTNMLSQYKLLDYEFSAPVEYKSGHFIFQFTPTYAIVQNQLPKGISTRISTKPSVFYFETGVSLKF
ncbi:hypothetical protein [Mucilaginibacter sp.]|uniref:hypothetical protein n=1 Tax=Mucilaginibacter sp. TaxID=1882438 RepID=UPI003D1528BA